jgi:hypothetical protein
MGFWEWIKDFQRSLYKKNDIVFQKLFAAHEFRPPLIYDPGYSLYHSGSKLNTLLHDAYWIPIHTIMKTMIGVEKTVFTPEQIAEYLADHYEAIVEYVKNIPCPRVYSLSNPETNVLI